MIMRARARKEQFRAILETILETIRQFITKEVANQMTPLKQVPGKIVFANLKLYSCLYG